MAFTEEEKESIRYYCGYGMIGSQALPANGYRFFDTYGILEYKMINMQPGEEAKVRDFYLANLPTLEQDIFGTRLNSDTAQAAVWFRNPNELRERKQLYNYFRLELCHFIGIPSGPGIVSGGFSFVV